MSKRSIELEATLRLALDRIGNYIERRKSARGIDIESIHAFDLSVDGGFELRLSDLELIKEALMSQSGGTQPAVTESHKQRNASEHLEPVAIHQFRSPYSSDWYDGVPDHHDGHGPYEVRTLYTTPPQRKPLTREQRIQIVKDNTVQGYHGDYFDAWGIIDDVEAAHDIKE